jgi:hypothetical protein
MDPMQTGIEAEQNGAPEDASAPEAAPEAALEAPADETSAAPPAAVAAEVAVAPAPPVEPFVSLYNSVWTTFAAVALGIFIVGSIQVAVARIFMRERNPHRALTQFVTAMVAIMVGVYVSDMLIAGPHVELLGEGERASILGFVKDTALMIFAYYFGTQSANAKEGGE